MSISFFNAWRQSLSPAAMLDDAGWMQGAVALARDAAAAGEVPVGALVVHSGQLVGFGANAREASQDPTSHAEMIALVAAARELGSWRLEECTLFVTLEPCPMCAGAILQARVPRVVYGALDPKAGAVESLFRLLADPRLNHRCETRGGVLADDCGRLLSEFFRAQRQMGKK